MAADDSGVGGPFRKAFALQLQEVERTVLEELSRLERALDSAQPLDHSPLCWSRGVTPSELPTEPRASTILPLFAEELKGGYEKVAGAQKAVDDEAPRTETPPEAVPPERSPADREGSRPKIVIAPDSLGDPRQPCSPSILRDIDEIARVALQVSSRMHTPRQDDPVPREADERSVRVSTESVDFCYESEESAENRENRLTRKNTREKTATQRIDDLELYSEWVMDTFVKPTASLAAGIDGNRGSQATQAMMVSAVSDGLKPQGRKGRRIRVTSADLEFFSARQGAAVHAERPRFLLNPSSHTRMCWDILGILFLSFDAFWIPLNLSTLASANQIIDLSTLIYWTCDVFVTFGTGYYIKGKLIMDHRKIMMNYLRTWFTLDMVIVGVGWISNLQQLASGGDDETEGSSSGQSVALFMVKGLKSARILRLLRLMKLKQLLYVIYEQIDSEWVSLMLGAAQNVIALLAVNHIVGCLWYLIGSQARGDQSKSWVTVHEARGDLNEPVGRYLMSLHWSLTQFTPASMQVHPENTGERAFTVAVLLLAMITFSSFVSSITTAMTRLRNLKTAELTQTLLLRRYLKDNSISRDLSARVIRYVNIILRRRKNTDRSKVTFLALLSGPLQVELQKELIQPHLTNYSFFESYELLSPPAMSQLCFVAVSALSLSKRDVLFHYGVESTRMYFLTEGALFYRRKCTTKRGPGRPTSTSTNDSSPRMVFLKAGSYFCEMPLWVKWSHRGHMRALTESTLYTLDAPKFREVTTSHQAVLHRSRAYAMECMNVWRSNAREHDKQLWDVGAGVSSLHRPGLKKGQSMPESEHIDEAVLMSASNEDSESDDDDEDEAGEGDDGGPLESAIRNVRQSLEMQTIDTSELAPMDSSESELERRKSMQTQLKDEARGRSAGR